MFMNSSLFADMAATLGTIHLSPLGDAALRIDRHRRPGLRGLRSSVCAGLAAFVLVPVLAMSARSQTPDPVQFIFAFNADVSAQLGSTTIDADERKRRFAALVDKGLDLDVIGERLLGWRWTGAPLADRRAFRVEFRNYLVQNFASKVKGLGDGHMTVTSVVQSDGTALVVTVVTTNEATRE